MLTHDEARNYIVGRKLKINNQTGDSNAILHDGDVLSFARRSGGIDGLMIQHNTSPTTFHNWVSSGSNEKFFQVAGIDILQADFEDGSDSIRFFFVFPAGDVDCFYFFFSESKTGINPLVTLQGSQVIDFGNQVIGDPPVGGPGPKN